MRTLLTGGGAGPYPRLRRLIDSVYANDGVEVSAVSDVTASAVTPVVRYALTDTFTVSHTASQPTYALSELRGVRRQVADAVYADLLASLTLDVVVTRDPGGIGAVSVSAIEDIASFADFESRFRYLDTSAFLAEHHITTVEELRTRYDYLLAEIQFRQPTQEEAAPQTISVNLSLACCLSEDLDVLPALRAARTLRAAVDAADTGRTDPLFGPPVHAAAVAVVFPESALGAGTPTAAQIDAVCAGAQVLPLFAAPP
jgi:hypothetical protein